MSWTESDTLSFNLTADGTSSVLDHERVMSDHAFAVEIIATPTSSWAIQMEGSLDGTNWFDIGSQIAASGLTVVLNTPARYVQMTGGVASGGSGSLNVTAQVVARE